MKKILILAASFAICLSLSAQGKSGEKGKDKQKKKDNTTQVDDKGKRENKETPADEKTKNDEHDRKVWDSVSDAGNCGKPSKNQPAKVRSSFQRDYPNAVNVRWTKCRGDWTATFSGGLFRSTAVYHANGDRRDTRTPVTRNEMPRITLDSVFKKRPGINIGDVIKIELPGKLDEIFRIKAGTDVGSEFLFFNKLGEMIKYDY